MVPRLFHVKLLSISLPFKIFAIAGFFQDHNFDVVTNVVGLAAAVLGDKFYWWLTLLGLLF